jgi:hypothetical protein
MQARYQLKLIAQRNKYRIKKMRPIDASTMIEAEYYGILRSITEYIKEKFIYVAVEGMAKPKVKEQWQDANYSSKMTELINEITRSTNTRFNQKKLAELIKRIVLKTDRYQSIRFMKAAEYGYGFDIGKLPEFKAYKPFINAVIQKNISLIENLRDETLYKLELSLRTAVQQGKSIAQVRNEIMSAGQITKRRAALIARNEIKSLTSELNVKRAVNAGFTTYEWLTAQDERVRGNPAGEYAKAKTNHYIMSGMLCKYEDDSVYSDNGGHTWKKRTAKMPTGKPGQEINCRCTTASED